MTFNQQPKANGLYRPEFEHDACGIGIYAHIKGQATHDIVKKGMHMLDQLDHRGGQGNDLQTGDGAGLMVQLPDEFFRNTSPEIVLPEIGRYGVGMLFLPNNETERKVIELQINSFIEQEGLEVLGWRTVPINTETLSDTARHSSPFVRQIFIGANKSITNELSFERKLYIIRKQSEKWAKKADARLYFLSLSSRTIVYKGLLTPKQLETFYLDLQDELFVSAFALVHNRFSTNTFPSWERAHPNRYLVHNGEINTLRGNIHWMKAREKIFISEAFGEDLDKVLPIVDMDGSDSSILDNALEFLILAGRSPAHAAMMLIPEPWSDNPHISDEKKAFYEYHSCLMEPWDGPTAISFTNGKQLGAILDRNGLRPARYIVTDDDYIIFSTEVGVIDVAPEKVLYKDRLSPGKMLLIDFEEGRIISDEEIKTEVAKEFPYQQWLNTQLIKLKNDGQNEAEEIIDLIVRQRAFGYTYEDISKYLILAVDEGHDPISAMGNDAPLAVLSDRNQSLFNYFKQLFAQVTNPPIDSIREKIVTSTKTLLGSEDNILHPSEFSCRRIQLDTPILSENQFIQLKTKMNPNFKLRIIDSLFTHSLEEALEKICQEADEAISADVSLLVLSDRKMNRHRVAIPALLAASALHHHLIRQGSRTKVSIIVESGEVREVHHYATLLGYGVDAIYPYLAFATYHQAVLEGSLLFTYEEVVKKYIQCMTEGIVKVMSKMGISTIQSYRGAQIFEAVGISHEVINRYFTGTVSQLDGIGLDIIAKEAIAFHETAYSDSFDQTLDQGSNFQWRKNGEYHAFNPKTVQTLRKACRNGDYQLFKNFSKLANEEKINFLRNLFDLNPINQPLPIDEVESIDSIVQRFKTGAMSFGSISEEAHETMAVAMNRLGAKSNSGEGGENANRYIMKENGDNRRSAIKQIASGRFGVNSHYLVNAEELQIKMAQGAKPGEGGHLPGSKVYPWIGKVRGSTPGVGLISPPPHHDIYSIEDLAQMIHDLKNANRTARISVKLVAKSGVGTIAAGVAKGAADVIVISGYDGGTGAAPKTSIQHAGLPWELGLAEAHQTLMINGLREYVVLETDGKLMTGRDVVMAALLGAEEFSFATAPLVVLGCVMARVCHLDTCPVGIATQDPKLRKKFTGESDYIVNYMRFVAQEVRELLAGLGFKTIEEMVGRTDILTVSKNAKSHWKAKYLDLMPLLFQAEGVRTFKSPQNHKLQQSLDIQQILPIVQKAVIDQVPLDVCFPIRNVNRVVGTIVGSEISKLYGEAGLPEDTITLRFTGAAGQSFGAFVPRGMTLEITGDVNDYLGKGLSGGKLIVKPHVNLQIVADKNVIAGNVVLYGATSGQVFINGCAGERFAVRNSGANAVVEGVGDHGCEYMTGGTVVVLGNVGKNFAAGMSGGIAYVLTDNADSFKQLCNQEMIEIESIQKKDQIKLKHLVQQHLYYTDSMKARFVLENWNEMINKFVKVIPKDYKHMVSLIEKQKTAGLTEEEAVMSSFLTISSKQKTSKKLSALVE